MTEAPGEVDEKQLQELGIEIAAGEAEAEGNGAE